MTDLNPFHSSPDHRIGVIEVNGEEKHVRKHFHLKLKALKHLYNFALKQTSLNNHLNAILLIFGWNQSPNCNLMESRKNCILFFLPTCFGFSRHIWTNFV
jgi:hypothetical protein